MSTNTSFAKLIELSKSSNLGFNLEFVEENSLKFTNHYHPWSILENEATILYDLIVKNNLKRGFEISTGIGISSTITGEAFKITNGKLVTVDAYVEETFNNCAMYDINTRITKRESSADGHKMAKFLHQSLNIDNNVQLEIGWSPDDIPDIYQKNFKDNKLDYVFIDGGHSKEQIRADINVLLPFLSDNALFMLHDFICVDEREVSTLKNNGFIQFRHYQTKFHLVGFCKGNIIL